MVAAGELAGEVGLEPTTPGFGDRYSSRLSYTPAVRTAAVDDAICSLHLPQNTATGKTDQAKCSHSTNG